MKLISHTHIVAAYPLVHGRHENAENILFKSNNGFRIQTECQVVLSICVVIILYFVLLKKRGQILTVGVKPSNPGTCCTGVGDQVNIFILFSFVITLILYNILDCHFVYQLYCI